MKKTLSQNDYSTTHTDTIGVLNFSAVHDAALLFLSPVEGKNILDLGCGNGEVLSLVIDNGGTAYGIDYDPASVKQANDIAGTVVQAASIADPLRYESDFFDAIVSLGTVGYLSKDDMKKTFVECNRVLKQGGKFIIRTPSTINLIGTFILKLIKKRYVTNTHFYPLSFYKNTLISTHFTIVSIHRSLDDGIQIKRSFPKSFIRRLLFPFLAPVWIQVVKS